jgi:membrane-associated phospholipid phosphatase
MRLWVRFASLLFPVLLCAGESYAQPPLNAPVDQVDRRDLVYYPGDTEHIVPLIHKLAANIWLDQRTVWTSPFHMRNKAEAGKWIGFTALIAGAVLTDRRTAHLLENSPGQVSWGDHISNIGASYTVLPVFAGFYAAGVFANNEKSRETGILSGEAILDSLIAVEGLKLAAGRNRPNALSKPGDFFQGGASFPSGHSGETWALASVISHEYANRKWAPWVAYGLATSVAAARIAAQKHYTSDVIAGSAIGFFIGRFVVNTHEVHAKHHHGTITATIAPLVNPSASTYGVSFTLGD